MTTSSQMEKEASEAPAVVANQLKKNEAILKTFVNRLQKSKLKFAMTIARGSSGHAALFAKYLLETRFQLIAAQAAPAVFTLYKTELPLQDSLVIAISQSGSSPDVAEMLHAARRTGAITAAFVNNVDSPLAKAAEYVIPLHAGEERSVAATKTFLATMSALIQWIAYLADDHELLAALSQLPESLQQACAMDWSTLVTELKPIENAYVVGRGYGFPFAKEAALKLKEVARIHAEGLSSAELLHGPFVLVREQFPVIVVGQQDATLPGLLNICQRMGTLGAHVYLGVPAKNEIVDPNLIHLPLPKALHPICDPLLFIQAFYMAAARLSRARGFDPDQPNHLTKVTHTW